MSTKRRFFSGKSVEQALLMAAAHYKMEAKEIGYRERKNRRGAGKSRKTVVIEVDPDNLRVAPGSPPPVAEEQVPEPASPLASFDTASLDTASSDSTSSDARSLEEAPIEVAPVMETDESMPPMPEGWVVAADRAATVDASSDAGSGASSDVSGFDAPIENAVDFIAEEGMVALPEASAASGPSVSAPPGVTTPESVREEEEDAAPVRRRRSRRRSSSRSRDEDHPKASQEEVFAAARENVALLVSLAGLELSVEVSEGEERLEIDLSGPDIEDALAEDGEVLEAVEYLAPRMMRASLGYLVPCRVDGDGFRQERDEDLVRLAKSMAAKVRESGRPKSLEPMNPADRRLIHVSLAEEPGVVTESVGDGFFKRVSIRPGS